MKKSRLTDVSEFSVPLDLDASCGSQAGQINRLEELHFSPGTQRGGELGPRSQHQISVLHRLVISDLVETRIIKSGSIQTQHYNINMSKNS